MKIYVTGGLLQSRPEDELLVRALGRGIVSGGHTLLQGYYNRFDEIIAEAAFEASKDNPLFPDRRLAVQSFITKNSNPPDVPWLVRKLAIADWDPGEEGWSLPEPIQLCDVAIVLGGGAKTLRAANLCRLAQKPLLPITVLNGAAIEVFKKEIDRFSEFYEGRISKERYSLLDGQNRHDFEKTVQDALQIASLIVKGNTVFIVMPFREESEDTFSTIKEVCKEFGLNWERTDKDATTNRIYQRIVNGIQRAVFVVADVSIESLNVYYELGFAEALRKPVIVIAKEGTQLPFDTKDIPTTMFRNQTRLKEALSERIGELVGTEAKIN